MLFLKIDQCSTLSFVSTLKIDPRFRMEKELNNLNKSIFFFFFFWPVNIWLYVVNVHAFWSFTSDQASDQWCQFLPFYDMRPHGEEKLATHIKHEPVYYTCVCPCTRFLNKQPLKKAYINYYELKIRIYGICGFDLAICHLRVSRSHTTSLIIRSINQSDWFNSPFGISNSIFSIIDTRL